MLIITVEGFPGPHVEYYENGFILANHDQRTIINAKNTYVEMVKTIVKENVAAIALFPKWFMTTEDNEAKITTDKTANNGIIRIGAKSSRFELYDQNVKLTQSTDLIGPSKQVIAKTIIQSNQGRINVDIEDKISKKTLHWYSEKDNEGFDARYETLEVEHFLYNPLIVY